MEVLLWLVPPVAVTVLAMAWVSWAGRAGRGEVDREEAVRRLGLALEKEARPATARREGPVPSRSGGVAQRRTRPPAQL